MKVFTSPSALRSWRAILPLKKEIGFVPTMGALHRGHLSLLNRAQNENDIVIASIFVNPIQFGPKEDFKRYPRPHRRDRQFLEKAGIKFLFSPNPNSMYSSHTSTRVSVGRLTETLCAAKRSRGPRHFEGVATVVSKLFNCVRPTRAYFGMKDFQQMRVIEKLNQDLNFGIKIVRCPTVREPDGLAVSSRNVYLSPFERRAAPKFYHALQQGAKLLRSQPRMNPRAVCQKVNDALTLPASQFKIEYIELVSPITLQSARAVRRPVLLAGAVWLGKTRLIDNILVN